MAKKEPLPENSQPDLLQHLRGEGQENSAKENDRGESEGDRGLGHWLGPDCGETPPSSSTAWCFFLILKYAAEERARVMEGVSMGMSE